MALTCAAWYIRLMRRAIETTKSALLWTILIGGAVFVLATAVAVVALLAARH